MSSITGSQGRGVIVTGSGSGIGRAAALWFAQLGDKVLVVDLNADGAEAVVKESRRATALPARSSAT